MECPYCGADSRVLDSRRSGDDIRRRRECASCERRFTTYERVASPEIHVVKRNDRTPEDFDRHKLLRVVLRVTRDRPVTKTAAHDLVRGLEAELVDMSVQTITAWDLATRLHRKLVELDAIAASRFASNYLQSDGSIHMTPSGQTPQLALPLTALPSPKPRRKR